MKKKDYIILIIIIIIMAILVLDNCIAIPCIFHSITGFYCPGCGITRAIKAALKGDFYSSFRNNILLYTIIPLIFIIQFFNSGFMKKYKKIDEFNKKHKKIYNCIIIVLVVVAIIYGVLRNIPKFWFLAPIEESDNKVLLDFGNMRFLRTFIEKLKWM